MSGARRGNTTWDARSRKQLVDLHNSGATPDELGERFGRPPRACTAELTRMRKVQ